MQWGLLADVHRITGQQISHPVLLQRDRVEPFMHMVLSSLEEINVIVIYY